MSRTFPGLTDNLVTIGLIGNFLQHTLNVIPEEEIQ
ncbi:hypothetical protein TNIN_135541, partial [Trichonephila inaurata madagascariensis]